jgi:hypothetical protein
MKNISCHAFGWTLSAIYYLSITSLSDDCAQPNQTETKAGQKPKSGLRSKTGKPRVPLGLCHTHIASPIIAHINGSKHCAFRSTEVEERDQRSHILIFQFIRQFNYRGWISF